MLLFEVGFAVEIRGHSRGRHGVERCKKMRQVTNSDTENGNRKSGIARLITDGMLRVVMHK
jgi:hypothetical protein